MSNEQIVEEIFHKAQGSMKNYLEEFSQLYNECKKNPTEESLNELRSGAFIIAALFLKYELFFTDDQDSWFGIPLRDYDKLFFFISDDMKL